MFNCTVCGIYTKNGRSIEEYIGNPPQLIVELIEQCLGKLEILLFKNIVCETCTEKLQKYYETKCQADNLQQELLALFKFSTFHLRKTLYYDEENCMNIGTDSNFECKSSTEMKYEKSCSPVFKSEISDGEYIDYSSFSVEHDDDDYVENDIAKSQISALNEFGTQNSETYTFTQIKKRISSKSSQSSDEIKCPACDQTFKNKRAYRAHNKETHFSSFVCDQCGKTLHSYSGFLSHKRNHNPVKKFHCTVCDEAYNNKNSLNLHMAWHTGEKPFQCDICKKKFTHKVGLYKHKQIHDEKTRRIECEECGSKFRSNAHLNRHMLTHTGARPYGCPICGKFFALTYNLKVHIREHESPGSTRQRRFKCKRCSRTFTNKTNFEDHCKGNDCVPLHTTKQSF